MKGSIQVKKHYNRLTAIIASLIFLAFLLFEGLYTYVTATKIMNEKMAAAKNHTLAAFTAQNRKDSVNIIGAAYSDFEIQSWYNADDIGFYGMIELDDGRIVESGDFVEILSVNKDTPENPNSRYFPVTPGFKSEGRIITVFSIDAMCDSNFIFGGKFTYVDTDYNNPVEYTIGENELASPDDAVPVSEWQGDKSLHAEYYTMAKNKYEAGLNEQSKQLLADVRSKTDMGYVFKIYQDDGTFFYKAASSEADSMQKKIDSGQVVSFVENKLTTSYYISHSCINSDTDNAFLCYLFHPLELTFRYHIVQYIMSLIALIIAESAVVLMMRKMYGNRMSYELMRQDLTRSIAHDLKTPLAVVKAYTENWEHIDEEDRPEYAEKLNAEVDDMASVINNMLNMSKLDSTNEIKLEEVDLYTIAAEIYEHIKPVISERGLNVRLITDVIGGKYAAYADPKMIRIAIGNFITNAVKYADSRVEIKLLSNEKNITFMVTNDGQCISKKDIKKIWEPFYKADKARTDRMGSSGMGLAINKGILRLHKAKYKCVSSNNETSFWFELKKVK